MSTNGTGQNNAGIKFSQLPSADLPLAGTEAICIVQGGISKQVPASALTGNAAGYVAAAAAAGANNNFAPAGFGATTKILDVSTAAGIAQLTGLLAGTNNQRVVITNLGPNQLRIDALAGTSLAANQFREAVNTALLTNMSIEVLYSTDVNKWLVIP